MAAERECREAPGNRTRPTGCLAPLLAVWPAAMRAPSRDLGASGTGNDLRAWVSIGLSSLQPAPEAKEELALRFAEPDELARGTESAE